MRKGLIERFYEAASIQRWNDHVRPFELTELDKQAHKMVLAYFIGKWTEEHTTVDWIRLIEGGIFEFLQRVVLDQRPRMLRIGGQVIALATRPRRRLGLIGAEIANGPQGRLFGPEAVVRVETGLPVTETRRLRLSVAGVDRVIDVAVTEGIGECRLADCLPAGLPLAQTLAAEGLATRALEPAA